MNGIVVAKRVLKRTKKARMRRARYVLRKNIINDRRRVNRAMKRLDAIQAGIVTYEQVVRSRRENSTQPLFIDFLIQQVRDLHHLELTERKIIVGNQIHKITADNITYKIYSINLEQQLKNRVVEIYKQTML